MMKRTQLTVNDLFTKTIISPSFVKSIYVDDDERSILTNNQNLDLSTLNNLLEDDEYLEIVNGEYVLNREAILEKYSDYYIEMTLPKIMEDDETISKINEVYQDAESDLDFINSIFNLECCLGLTLVIQHPDYVRKLEQQYKPDIPKMEMDCVLLQNVYFLEDPITIDKNRPDIECIYETIGVFDMANVYRIEDIISKRIGLYSVTLPVNQGTVDRVGAHLYFTEDDGTVKCLQ